MHHANSCALKAVKSDTVLHRYLSSWLSAVPVPLALGPLSVSTAEALHKHNSWLLVLLLLPHANSEVIRV